MLNIVPKTLPNKNWKKIVDQLVIENCLAFGDDSKFTQKGVARYLLGTRSTFEIFKLYELRYLLLKVYPFIQNLFYNPRLSSTLRVKKLWNRNYSKQLETQRKLGKRVPSHKWKPRVRIINSFVQKEKNLTPQVLFATVTPMYTDIIKVAAQICNMPSHENRWLNGSITAAISYQEDNIRWNYITDETPENSQNFLAQTLFHATRKWGSNKENPEKTKEKSKYYGESRWPSLIIIPDISNNIMILKEARKVGIPVMGLVNSSTSFQIDYPVFAQEQTVQSVHFFCHFLATLIAKEMVYIQHKRYILQKKKRKLKSKDSFKKKSLLSLPLPKSRHRKLQTFLKKSSSHYKKPLGWITPRGKKNERFSKLPKGKTRRPTSRRNYIFFRIVKPTNDSKIPDTEWHTEYSMLKSEGPYTRKLRYSKFRKSQYNEKYKSQFKQKYEAKSGDKLKTKLRVSKKQKRNKKCLSLRKTFFSYKRTKKGQKYLKRNLKLKKTSRNSKKPKEHFTHLRHQLIIKIITRYLKKKNNDEPSDNAISILKKQKYLSLILNLKKRFRFRMRRRTFWRYLQSEVFKKRFSKKKNYFLTVSEERQLWKKIHSFLTVNKIIRFQTINKVVRFKIAKFHTEYKNYYGQGLKQWRQTLQFASAKHDFAIFVNYIAYKSRLVERQYYDAHPAAWKAQKAWLYKLRCWNRSSKESKKKNWNQWTKKNTLHSAQTKNDQRVKSSYKQEPNFKKKKEVKK